MIAVLFGNRVALWRNVVARFKLIVREVTRLGENRKPPLAS